MKPSPVDPRHDQQLITDILTFKDDPYGFVMYAFPWGQKGTPLEHKKGPRVWQTKYLKDIAAHLKQNRTNKLNNKDYEVLRKSMVSGRGPGKSAMVAWLIMWMMSTNLGSTTIVAANNEPQLRDKTWPEMGKWHMLSINAHWFEKTAMSLKPQPWFEDILNKQLNIDTGYYYAKAQLWTEENPDAFAGAHNDYGIQVLFDEASGIPAPVWKVTEGFFTEITAYRFWHVFSNGRRNTGAFFETHHRNRDFWQRLQINSQDIEDLDQNVFNSIIRQFGADSDEARVEVYGQFPRLGDNQFISREVVADAVKRVCQIDNGSPLVIGVDVARFGDDHTVVLLRRGRKLLEYHRYKGMDNVQVAQRVAEIIDKKDPDATFIDGGGPGGGVVDILKAQKYKVIDIEFGSKPDDQTRYQDKRTEMWGNMRQWLIDADIIDDSLLHDDLLAPEYLFSLNGKLKLEAKEHMKKRHLASPDIADALALTFARNVGRRDRRSKRNRKPTMQRGLDYNMFS